MSEQVFKGGGVDAVVDTKHETKGRPEYNSDGKHQTNAHISTQRNLPFW